VNPNCPEKIQGLTHAVKVKMWLTPTCVNIAPTEERREKRTAYRESIGRQDSPGGLAEQVMSPKFWTAQPTRTFADEMQFETSEEYWNRQPTPPPSSVKWPTPNASDSNKWSNQSQAEREAKGQQVRLNTAVSPEGGAGALLNPTWVEKLMGWPRDWTDLQPMNDYYFISWLMGFCENAEIRTKEVLRVLRNSVHAQEFQRKTGIPIDIQEAEILLAVMFENKVSSSAAWGLVDICKKGVTIQTLPRFMGCDGKEAWRNQTWEDDVPRTAHKVPARVGRLKAIGNGQVPLCAAEAFLILSKKDENNL